MSFKSEEKKKVKRTDIQSHFVPKILIGKSYVRTGMPLNTPHTVTDKFHTKDIYKITDEKIETTSEKLKVLDPRDKYSKYVTENQRYGWYQDKLNDVDVNDKRLHFAKQTDEWIKLYLLTAEKKITNKSEMNKKKN